eukprot:TRINITY_DN22298_c0_g1_i1.p1 TRINITY_DN22298_c0_g1~~TRINITY_DN22298_c0_g1_i1.p1  ORF type:complete len:1397 (-),score=304.78 TRINITY_DN22298_c0_g1_i1:48-4238(-)
MEAGELQEWEQACNGMLSLGLLSSQGPFGVRGWAFKLGKMGWDKRYIAVRFPFLFYFRADVPSEKTLGCIFLRDVGVSAEEQKGKPSLVIRQQIDRRPGIDDNLFVLGFKDEKVRDTWAAQLVGEVRANQKDFEQEEAVLREQVDVLRRKRDRALAERQRVEVELQKALERCAVLEQRCAENDTRAATRIAELRKHLEEEHQRTGRAEQQIADLQQVIETLRKDREREASLTTSPVVTPRQPTPSTGFGSLFSNSNRYRALQSEQEQLRRERDVLQERLAALERAPSLSLEVPRIETPLTPRTAALMDVLAPLLEQEAVNRLQLVFAEQALRTDFHAEFCGALIEMSGILTSPRCDPVRLPSLDTKLVEIALDAPPPPTWATPRSRGTSSGSEPGHSSSAEQRATEFEQQLALAVRERNQLAEDVQRLKQNLQDEQIRAAMQTEELRQELSFERKKSANALEQTGQLQQIVEQLRQSKEREAAAPRDATVARVMRQDARIQTLETENERLRSSVARLEAELCSIPATPLALQAAPAQVLTNLDIGLVESEFFARSLLLFTERNDLMEIMRFNYRILVAQNSSVLQNMGLPPPAIITVDTSELEQMRAQAMEAEQRCAIAILNIQGLEQQIEREKHATAEAQREITGLQVVVQQLRLAQERESAAVASLAAQNSGANVARAAQNLLQQRKVRGLEMELERVVHERDSLRQALRNAEATAVERAASPIIFASPAVSPSQSRSDAADKSTISPSLYSSTVHLLLEESEQRSRHCLDALTTLLELQRQTLHEMAAIKPSQIIDDELRNLRFELSWAKERLAESERAAREAQLQAVMRVLQLERERDDLRRQLPVKGEPRRTSSPPPPQPQPAQFTAKRDRPPTPYGSDVDELPVPQKRDSATNTKPKHKSKKTSEKSNPKRSKKKPSTDPPNERKKKSSKKKKNHSDSGMESDKERRKRERKATRELHRYNADLTAALQQSEQQRAALGAEITQMDQEIAMLRHELAIAMQNEQMLHTYAPQPVNEDVSQEHDRQVRRLQSKTNALWQQLEQQAAANHATEDQLRRAQQEIEQLKKANHVLEEFGKRWKRKAENAKGEAMANSEMHVRAMETQLSEALQRSPALEAERAKLLESGRKMAQELEQLRSTNSRVAEGLRQHMQHAIRSFWNLQDDEQLLHAILQSKASTNEGSSERLSEKNLALKRELFAARTAAEKEAEHHAENQQRMIKLEAELHQLRRHAERLTESMSPRVRCNPEESHPDLIQRIRSLEAHCDQQQRMLDDQRRRHWDAQMALNRSEAKVAVLERHIATAEANGRSYAAKMTALSAQVQQMLSAPGTPNLERLSRSPQATLTSEAFLSLAADGEAETPPRDAHRPDLGLSPMQPPSSITSPVSAYAPR